MADDEKLISSTLDGTEGMELPVDCGKCNTTTFHRVVASAETVHGIADDTGRVTTDHQIIQCQGCKTISFRSTWTIGDTNAAEPMVENVEVYPPRADKTKRRLIDGMGCLPKNVRPIYLETVKALNAPQPVLGGIGIRALAEAVCRQKRAKGKNLEKRIDSPGRTTTETRPPSAANRRQCGCREQRQT